MPELHTRTADAPSMPDSKENKHRRRADAAADRQATRPAPDHQAVEMRAYELYLQRGGNDGEDVGDWLAAERELEAS